MQVPVFLAPSRAACLDRHIHHDHGTSCFSPAKSCRFQVQCVCPAARRLIVRIVLKADNTIMMTLYFTTFMSSSSSVISIYILHFLNLYGYKYSDRPVIFREIRVFSPLRLPSLQHDIFHLVSSSSSWPRTQTDPEMPDNKPNPVP